MPRSRLLFVWSIKAAKALDFRPHSIDGGVLVSGTIAVRVCPVVQDLLGQLCIPESVYGSDVCWVQAEGTEGLRHILGRRTSSHL